MNKNINVFYNDEKIKCNNFTKYVDNYFPPEGNHVKVLDITDDNWKIAVVFDPTDTLDHQNISFVNGICTIRGGTHVDYVVNQIVKKISATLAKKKNMKNLNIKPAMIKENLIFFVDAVIINPEFDSQSKERLTTRVTEFGSKYDVPQKFLNQVITKTGIIERIMANVQAKALTTLEKSTGSGNLASKYPKYYGV